MDASPIDGAESLLNKTKNQESTTENFQEHPSEKIESRWDKTQET